MGLVFAALACEKGQTNFSESPLKKNTDPVIEYYSHFGAVKKMSHTYQGQSSNVCSNHNSIYQYVPNSGPFAGQTCEIYRFTELSDISGPCDDTFNLLEETIETGAIKYTSCPKTGKNCKELDMPWGCTLVFCDEGEVG